MTFSNAWDKKDVDKLIELRNSGVSMRDIAKQLDKTHSSVKMYVQRHKGELGLRPALDFKPPAKSPNNDFENRWHGPVPFGHWTITKPWKKAS